MTLCEVYLCAKALLSEVSFEQGLLRVARLGRYGHSEEREAALLLDAFRAGSLGLRAQQILALSVESVQILEALHGTDRRAQFERVLANCDISAGRVLLCDSVMALRSASGGREAKEVVARLLKWLPGEATQSLKTGKLDERDVQSLFAPRHSAMNYL